MTALMIGTRALSVTATESEQEIEYMAFCYPRRLGNVNLLNLLVLPVRSIRNG